MELQSLHTHAHIYKNKFSFFKKKKKMCNCASSQYSQISDNLLTFSIFFQYYNTLKKSWLKRGFKDKKKQVIIIIFPTGRPSILSFKPLIFMPQLLSFVGFFLFLSATGFHTSQASVSLLPHMLKARITIMCHHAHFRQCGGTELHTSPTIFSIHKMIKI